MSIVSWNFRGLGSDPKVDVVKDIIKIENPFIFLLQETKMIRIGNHIWKGYEGITNNSRGASKGLCTLWNAQEVSMESVYQTSN
jgi:exonuclease III